MYVTRILLKELFVMKYKQVKFKVNKIDVNKKEVTVNSVWKSKTCLGVSFSLVERKHAEHAH